MPQHYTASSGFKLGARAAAGAKECKDGLLNAQRVAELDALGFESGARR